MTPEEIRAPSIPLRRGAADEDPAYQGCGRQGAVAEAENGLVGTGRLGNLGRFATPAFPVALELSTTDRLTRLGCTQPHRHVRRRTGSKIGVEGQHTMNVRSRDVARVGNQAHGLRGDVAETIQHRLQRYQHRSGARGRLGEKSHCGILRPRREPSWCGAHECTHCPPE